MPRALAIETSGRSGSIATVIDGTIAREESFTHGLQNAAKILPIIDQLCRAQSWTPRDIDEIYVSIGPGSFTGLRIGVTIAKTIALTCGSRIVAVPTVEVLARNAPPDARNIVIVLDAKRDQIFTARFSRTTDSEWMTEEPAHLDSLTEMLRRSPRPVHLLGEGIPFHQKFLPADDPEVIVTTPELWQARATRVAQIGWQMSRANLFTDADRLAPVYIRLPEAEEKWNASRSAQVNET
ncbi:MAG: tRNA (adenosine(37)-N6)-threonylcarbamoyltransferase complex dimerization subunit type 1 TsaB [Anaerolineae bacterium]|nr:tRNA (adenosine(37)-N6)-threonylcarbamoyltransferase complex dimerization subunit type 1 TsaB [Phycisphaerae bacterium]